MVLIGLDICGSRNWVENSIKHTIIINIISEHKTDAKIKFVHLTEIKSNNKMYNMTRGATANLSQASPNILLHFLWPVVSYKSRLKPKIQARPRPLRTLPAMAPLTSQPIYWLLMNYVILFHIDNNKSKIKTNKTEKSITNSLSMRFKVSMYM